MWSLETYSTLHKQRSRFFKRTVNFGKIKRDRFAKNKHSQFDVRMEKCRSEAAAVRIFFTGENVSTFRVPPPFFSKTNVKREGKVFKGGKSSRERLMEGKTKIFRQNRGKTLPPDP